MKNRIQLNTILILTVLCGAATSASAQSINLWRGNETKADWSDPYKWKLKHAPAGDEFVHFRSPNAVVAINNTIKLDNGIMLYGEDLFLRGDGNINMWSPVEYKSTVNIPASSSGHANLTLSDNLSLNGRIALAAKSFGTSASKGSVTLKDCSTITGKLSIGNNGSGSGQVFVRDQSTYRIEELEFNTLAEKGGAAELHILGGTVHLDTKANPFDTFLEDPSRKIIIGDNGQLKINSEWTIQHKKNVISEMISQKHIVAAQGCELMTPEFQQNMVLIKAKISADPRSIDMLLADIQQSAETIPPAAAPTALVDTSADTSQPEIEANSSRLNSLLKESKTTVTNPAVAAAQPKDKTGTLEKEESESSSAPLTGYIVFFSAALFFLRPAKRKEEDPAPKEKTTDD